VQSLGSQLLQNLLSTSVIRQDDWDKLPLERKEQLQSLPDAVMLLNQLIDLKLLADHQLSEYRWPLKCGPVRKVRCPPMTLAACLPGAGGR